MNMELDQMMMDLYAAYQRSTNKRYHIPIPDERIFEVHDLIRDWKDEFEKDFKAFQRVQHEIDATAYCESVGPIATIDRGRVFYFKQREESSQNQNARECLKMVNLIDMVFKTALLYLETRVSRVAAAKI
jgi:hypothetical protein